MRSFSSSSPFIKFTRPWRGGGREGLVLTKEIMETQEPYNDRTQTAVQKKYYEVVGSDIFLNKKLIVEGTVIDTYDESLSKFLRELPASEIAATPNYSTINQSAPNKRGRPRKT